MISKRFPKRDPVWSYLSVDVSIVGDNSGAAVSSFFSFIITAAISRGHTSVLLSVVGLLEVVVLAIFALPSLQGVPVASAPSYTSGSPTSGTRS